MNLLSFKWKIVTGNEALYKELYNRNASKLLNAAYRITLNLQEAEDVLQELFVKLPKIIWSFKGKAKFDTWIYRAMINECINRKKVLNRKADLINSQGRESQFTDSQHFEKAELLEKLLYSLSAEDRALLWMKEAEGFEIKEIAELLNIKIGTLKSRLSRLRKKIKSQSIKQKESYGTDF